MNTNVFFTADEHYGHKNIIKYTNRPFSSVEEMNKTLISNHNSVVKPLDRVYHLGDFCLDGKPEKYLNRLNGRHVFIKGSHDRLPPSLGYVSEDSIFPVVYEDQMIVLCHYAMRSWQQSHYGSWHLFGHHHGKLESYGLSFDVGVDCWDFFPVSLKQVQDKMRTLNPIVDFRK